MTAPARRGRILVTPRSLTSGTGPVHARLREAGYEVIFSRAGHQPDEGELLELVPGCVGWLAGVEPVSPAVISAATSLRAISRNGVGVDNLPLDVMRARGIALLTTPGANAIGVTELTIGLMLAALRHIPATDAGIKAGRWPRLLGRELHGTMVGIVGCGEIGRRVSEICVAFGTQVFAFDPARPAISLHPDKFRWAEIEELLSASDVVSLHCPPTAGGRPLLDGKMLARLRPGAVLVNTARSSLVDEKALLDALECGLVQVYATDVFDREPPSSLDLAGHPSVIATSHVGGLTRESAERAAGAAAENLIEALAITE